jgi:hypothetical protein
MIVNGLGRPSQLGFPLLHVRGSEKGSPLAEMGAFFCARFRRGFSGQFYPFGCAVSS